MDGSTSAFSYRYLAARVHISTSSMSTRFDCIVVGSGHAGSCAALSAIEAGCKKVLIVEKAPSEWSGGNGYFTAGAHRTTHDGLEDLLSLVNNVSPELAMNIDVEPYTAAQFTEDINRLGGGQADQNLVETVVDGSRKAVGWLKERVGIPFILSFHRQAYEVDGRQKFWGGMALSVEDGGKGLIRAHQQALNNAGVEVWYECPAIRISTKGGRVNGILVKRGKNEMELQTPAVVLACGGFEANAEMRSKYLGSNWARARASHFLSDLYLSCSFSNTIRSAGHLTTLEMDSAWLRTLVHRWSATGQVAIVLRGMPMPQ
jgi:succinate dehydrogenase/fumarate reductase flavoprotein subunit